MYRRTGVVIIVLLSLVVSLLPGAFAFAADSEFTFTAQYRQDVKVVLDNSSTSELPTLDPAQGEDVVSINAIENLFLGLTNSDPITAQVNPELATDWTVSDDGLVWTFNLRSDVMWMRYDPMADTAAELRPVVAGDFVYGIKRACDPRLGSYYSTVIAPVVAGCAVINETPAEEVTDDLVYGDTVQVSAPDDATVMIELAFPAGYWLSMTHMWTIRPVHRETIEEFGDDWTAPGNIATNGPYFVREVVRGVRRSYVRNEALPADLLAGDGNIDEVITTRIDDDGTRFALYLDNQLDTSNIPDAELQSVLNDETYASEIYQIFDLAVFYFGYGYDKPPFDNVHVRRAFSAIIDREVFVEQIQLGQGVPMIHFTPPGIAFAPPINEVGVGYNPDYAREQLALAGYPDCEGFPNVEIITYAQRGNWLEFWASSAEQELGCDPALFDAEQLEFSVLLEATDASTPTEERANAWTLGWGPDYGDANNYLADVLACNRDNRFLRPCTEVDDLMEEAAREPDPDVRMELYAEIEEAFFGPEGEFPIAPIFLRSDFEMNKPWYSGPFETDALFGGHHWEIYSIDMAAKLAARGE